MSHFQTPPSIMDHFMPMSFSDQRGSPHYIITTGSTYLEWLCQWQDTPYQSLQLLILLEVASRYRSLSTVLWGPTNSLIRLWAAIFLLTGCCLSFPFQNSTGNEKPVTHWIPWLDVHSLAEDWTFDRNNVPAELLNSKSLQLVFSCNSEMLCRVQNLY